MKREKILLLVVAVSVAFSACTFEEDNLFDKSAAERLAHAKAKYTEELRSLSNGWVMDYFPTTDQEGYTFLVKFLSDESAVFAAKNHTTGNIFQRDTCGYEVIADNGPVLTFNLVGTNTDVSKVGIFHIFSNPEDGPDGNGIGYGGDYEFMILNSNSEQMMLKGKKRGVYVDLRRLSENKDWEEYFADLDAQKNYLFDNRVTLNFTANGEVIYNLDNSTNSIFAALPPGGDIVTDLVRIPFITTDYGLRFSQPYVIQGLRVRNFKLNAERNKLVAVENGNVTIEVLPVEFLRNSNILFLAPRQETSGLDILLDQINAEIISGLNPNFEIVSIGFVINNSGRLALALQTRHGAIALYFVPSAGTGNSLTISDFNANNMERNDMDNNGWNFIQRAESIKQLLTFIQGSYILETPTPFILRNIKFTKTDGSLMLNTSR